MDFNFKTCIFRFFKVEQYDDILYKQFNYLIFGTVLVV